MLTIVADENVLGQVSVSEANVNLIRLPGREITRAHLLGADALIVRSITPVNRALLEGTGVRFVGTATSGTDHIDREWLNAENIMLADAAGANANAVVDYVLSVFAAQIVARDFDPWSARVAIIGVGHVGSALARRLQGLGIACVGYDPFQQSVPSLDYVSLDQALKADVICVHTPLTQNTPEATFHLLNASRLASLSENTIVINASRGGVIDNRALAELLAVEPSRQFVLDVWENEPAPNADLLQSVNLATPHIAGYSVEAKQKAARCVIDRLRDVFSLPDDVISLPGNMVNLMIDSEQAAGLTDPVLFTEADERRIFARHILSCFDPAQLSEEFRRRYLKSGAIGSVVFDKLRRKQAERHEFSAWHVKATAVSPRVAAWLHAAGFVLHA